MELPEYVTLDETRRVCKKLGIRDWTALKTPDVTTEEAEAILKALGVKGMDIRLNDFRQGLEVELEHGTRFPDANVTNNHPILTAKIVLAHFKETLDYYDRLEVAELEGDLLKAVVAGNADKAATVLAKLARAREVLGRREAEQLP